jgi:hypothetical protein
MKSTGLAVLLAAAVAAGEPAKKHALPAAQSGGTVVGMCDGQTSVEVKALKPGAALSRDQAQAVSDQLMAAWRKRHPDARWDTAVAQNTPMAQNTPVAQNTPMAQNTPVAQNPPPATAPPPGAAPGQAAAPLGAHVQRGSYESFTNRDEMVWSSETQKFVDEGNHIFHDAKQLGGTIGVSCDMCHPNAANTHPETYPKFQVQLGRVALLRDMINWCLENPVKAKPMRDDDDRLRAMEAYIIAQRKGTRLEYGKH